MVDYYCPYCANRGEIEKLEIKGVKGPGGVVVSEQYYCSSCKRYIGDFISKEEAGRIAREAKSRMKIEKELEIERLKGRLSSPSLKFDGESPERMKLEEEKRKLEIERKKLDEDLKKSGGIIGEEKKGKIKNLFGRAWGGAGKGAKWTSKKAYEGKPSKNVEKYAKVILPIIAIAIGILILILLPGLWIIGIPAIIIGLGYLFFVIPTLDKFGFKQKIGFLLIVAGALMVLLVHSFIYGGIILGLGIVFIVYGQLTGKAKVGFKILELIITLALLILVVPSFLNWAGISISWQALFIFSLLNTFALFVLWSFSGGQNIKESLEEELLKKQIKKTEAETEDIEEKGKEADKEEESEEKDKLTEAEEKEEPIQKRKEICNICGGEIELYAGGKRCKECGTQFEE